MNWQEDIDYAESLMIIKCPKCGYSVDSNSPKCNIESDRPDDKIKCLECGCIDTYENFIYLSEKHNSTTICAVNEPKNINIKDYWESKK